MDKRRFSKLDLKEEQVITSYKNGMSLREIANLNDCSVGTIANFLESRGVNRRKKGRRKKEKQHESN